MLKMKKHPDVVAWEEWKSRELACENGSCFEPSILINPTHNMQFLENRFWHAFMAGRRSAKKKGKKK